MKRRRLRKRDTASASDNDLVGYGRPPKAHQFRPGQSGNPKGRRKGTKNTDTILREILDRKITIRVSGKERKVLLREAIVTKFAEDALKGNTKSASFLLQRYDAIDAAADPAQSNDDNDIEIINAFISEVKKKHGDNHEQ